MTNHRLETYILTDDSGVVSGLTKAEFLQLLFQFTINTAYTHILCLFTNTDSTSYYGTADYFIHNSHK